MRRPSGTVTFVFTDIEGSTRLLATHTPSYPEIVRRHREIIAAAAESEGGTVLGHEGDSCFLVFADSASAVAAVAVAQRQLREEAWPGAAEVKVRMGVHTGTTELSGEDYFGLTVHTASRIADAAHGGQIVVSAATVSAGLPETVEVRDLGIHRLKDLDSSIRLFQLMVSGLSSDFPPLRALPSVSLRRIPTSFVGREAETLEVARLLSEARVVTLLGPGGIGKTRFALHVANEHADRYPDGVWLADLTATDGAEAVADLIAEAVGVSVHPGGNPVSVVGDVLAHARGLLIVDNFEHVVEAAPVIAELVGATAELTVLVTSRERLRLNSERVFEVGPLSLHPDGAAVQLFCDRARAVRPDFDPSTFDIDAIVRICRRLDGIPLAIELAAARVRLLQPEEIARRLQISAIGLGGGARDLHARQQTIRSTIEWSFDLLQADEQELLAQLAVFAGPIRVDAVDAVLGQGDGATAETLAELVDKSLLQQRVDPSGATRVRMLELVREFALELLDTRADRRQLEARHAEYYSESAARTAREMLTDRLDAGTKKIEADYADIVHAFEWSVTNEPGTAVAIAAAMAYYFHSTGLLHTAARWAELTRDTPVDELMDAYRSIAAGYVEFGFNRLTEARGHWERAIPIVAAHGYRLAEAWATMSLGATYIGDPHNYGDALELIERGIKVADEAGSPVLVGLGFNIAGELSRVFGDDDAADAAYLAGSQVARTIDDHYREALTLGNRVFIATHRGEIELALSVGKAALDLHRRYGHHNQVPFVAMAIAGALTQRGQVEESVVLLGAADEASRRMRLEVMPGDVGETIAIRRELQSLAGSQFDGWYSRGRSMSLDEALTVLDG